MRQTRLAQGNVSLCKTSAHNKGKSRSVDRSISGRRKYICTRRQHVKLFSSVGGGKEGGREGGDIEEEQPDLERRAKAFGSLLVESLLRTLTKTNAPYLKRRKRTKWWKREAYPRVPKDPVEKKRLLNVLKAKQSEVKKYDEYIALFKKMAPLGLLFFCASFNLTLLQNTKDSLIVISGGAEQLPFLAAYCVLPMSLVFFVYYNKIIEVLKPQRVFYAALAPLLLFYALFASVLYPASGALHLNGAQDVLRNILPMGFHGLVGIICNWTYSLFFCFAELWGTIVISVLFWGVANDVCSVSEAKTVYPLLGIAANFALIAGGNYLKFVSAKVNSSFDLSLQVLLGSVLLVSGLMMFLKTQIDRSNEKIDSTKASSASKPKKKKMTFKESWNMICGAKKIRSLAMLVVGYAVSHRLFEVAWKGQLRLLYPTTQAYQAVLADVSIATGSVTILLMVLGRFVFQYFGWRTAALITPVLMSITGGSFFLFSLASKHVSFLDPVSVALFAATMGGLTQIIARSSKFALFDPAKEMVYIEMEEDERKKGKAAVDLVGSQVGKSGASWITQGTLLLFGSVQMAMPILSSVFGVVIFAWIYAANNLNKMLKEHEKTKRQEKEDAVIVSNGHPQVETTGSNGHSQVEVGASNGHSQVEEAGSGIAQVDKDISNQTV